MSNRPYKIKLESVKNYAWCSCGLSKREPFCDGSHSDSGMHPLIFAVEETKEYNLCGCKLTSNPPFCDNTHKSVKTSNK